MLWERGVRLPHELIQEKGLDLRTRGATLTTQGASWVRKGRVSSYYREQSQTLRLGIFKAPKKDEPERRPRSDGRYRAQPNATSGVDLLIATYVYRFRAASDDQRLCEYSQSTLMVSRKAGSNGEHY